MIFLASPFPNWSLLLLSSSSNDDDDDDEHTRNTKTAAGLISYVMHSHVAKSLATRSNIHLLCDLCKSHAAKSREETSSLGLLELHSGILCHMLLQLSAVAEAEDIEPVNPFESIKEYFSSTMCKLLMTKSAATLRNALVALQVSGGFLDGTASKVSESVLMILFNRQENTAQTFKCALRRQTSSCIIVAWLSISQELCSGSSRDEMIEGLIQLGAR